MGTHRYQGKHPDSLPLQPMTNEWNLWVGNLLSSESAKVALKVNKDGNVGMGTETPKGKLDVRGTIYAGQEMVHREITQWQYAMKMDR